MFSFFFFFFGYFLEGLPGFLFKIIYCLKWVVRGKKLSRPGDWEEVQSCGYTQGRQLDLSGPSGGGSGARSLRAGRLQPPCTVLGAAVRPVGAPGRRLRGKKRWGKGWIQLPENYWRTVKDEKVKSR